MAIHLACQAMDPEGPDVFAEPVGDLCHPGAEATREHLAARLATARAEPSPRDVAESRAALRAIAAAGEARAEALREVRTAEEAAEKSDISGRLSYEVERALEWVRKHQVTCSRALFRTFDASRSGFPA
jgi:hypothetical protein